MMWLSEECKEFLGKVIMLHFSKTPTYKLSVVVECAFSVVADLCMLKEIHMYVERNRLKITVRDNLKLN